MLETAVLFISMAIGRKLLDHAGDDVGDAFDASLRKLAQWVRQKVTTRQTGKTAVEIIEAAPAGEAGAATRDSGRKMLTAVLAEITADPMAAGQLRNLVAEVAKCAPPGLVDGAINADELIDSTAIGAMTSNPAENSQVKGSVVVKKAERALIIGALTKHDERPN